MFWKPLGKQNRLPAGAGTRGWQIPAQPPAARPCGLAAGRRDGLEAGLEAGPAAPLPKAPGERGTCLTEVPGYGKKRGLGFLSPSSSSFPGVFSVSVATLSRHFAGQARSSPGDGSLAVPGAAQRRSRCPRAAAGSGLPGVLSAGPACCPPAASGEEGRNQTVA